MSHSVGRGVGLVLSDEERDQLLTWSRGSSRLAVRARIVLGCADPGVSDEKVAVDVGVSRMTVQVWRRRFAEDRLAGLIDRQRPGRPKADLVLSPREREQLTRWSRRAKSSQALALRARIILACAASGATNKQVAADLRVMEHTVAKWRRRFVDKRLDGWSTSRGRSTPSIPPDKVEKKVVVATREEAPAMRRTGRGPQWPSVPACHPRRSGGSGAALTSNRIWSTGSSSLTDRSLWPKSSMSLVSTTIHRRKRWCCVWTRRARCRPSIRPSRCCR